MMNLSKIGWCDFQWNPVTGCRDNCYFCYGRHQAARLCGTVRINLGDPQIQKGPKRGLYILPAPFHNDSDKVIAYPAGFAPTLHPYRLDMIAAKKKPANIYVCSTGELLGEWIPEKWIDLVFDACKAAPWHNYMFLTKHPHRYTQLSDAEKLIEQDNIWYGSYLSDERSPFLSGRYHTFGYIDLSSPHASPCALPEFEWIIVGCDTPVFKHDEPPSRTALEKILLDRGSRPLFMKDSQLMRSIWDGALVQEFPMLLQRAPDRPIPHCKHCKQCQIIGEGKRGNRHICRHRKVLKEHKDGRHVPGRYARTSPEWCPKR